MPIAGRGKSQGLRASWGSCKLKKQKTSRLAVWTIQMETFLGTIPNRMTNRRQPIPWPKELADVYYLGDQLLSLQICPTYWDSVQ